MTVTLPSVSTESATSPRRPGRGRRLLAGSATSFLGYLLITTGWLAIAAGVVGLLARSVAWSWQPLIVAAAFFLYLTAIAVLGGVLLAVRRAWAGPVIAILLAATTIALLAPSYVADSPNVSGGRSLIVLQANLRVGAADPDKLVAQVRAEHADVLTVDELTSAELIRLTHAGISRELPYHLAAPYAGAAGTGIWSRYPLRATGRDDRFSFELLTARVTPPRAATTQLIAVHLLPPWPYPSGTWVSEMHRLHTLLGRQPPGMPVVVSGDFNATLDHAQFRGLLTGGFHDGAEQAGAGFLPTCPTDRFFPPLLPIDHILTRVAAATSVRTLPLAGSDHRALIAHLTIPARSGA